MRLPDSVAQQIARRAVTIAQSMAPRDTGAGVASFTAEASDGFIGISMLPYMRVQDQGMPPRQMVELTGKVIPIRTATGRVIFRTASPASMGRSRLVSRDEDGTKIAIRPGWMHPGLKGQGFVARSVRQAVAEWCMTASNQDVIQMLDESDVSFLIKVLKGEK